MIVKTYFTLLHCFFIKATKNRCEDTILGSVYIKLLKTRFARESLVFLTQFCINSLFPKIVNAPLLRGFKFLVIVN